jgi:hypothetical protein
MEMRMQRKCRYFTDVNVKVIIIARYVHSQTNQCIYSFFLSLDILALVMKTRQSG